MWQLDNLRYTLQIQTCKSYTFKFQQDSFQRYETVKG